MESGKLRKITSKNAYPQEFIDKCIYKLLNRTFERKPKVTTFPKKELRIFFFRYLGHRSNITKTKLTKAMNKNFANLRAVSQRLKNSIIIFVLNT